jgi:hypothetical protein
MAFTSTAAVADSLKSRIEALVPSDQTGADDVFRVQVGVEATLQGNRVVLLSAFGGMRKHLSGRTSTDWETQVEITIFYNSNVVTEAGQPTILQRALRDSEDVLADLYDWAASTVGINQIEPDLANCMDDGQGSIQVARVVRVEFQRA